MVGSKKIDYTIVVPVFNSALILPNLIRLLKTEILKITPHYEIILVDDFSEDNSWEVIQKECQSNQNHIRAIRLKKNYGQYIALFEGLQISIGKWIITIDDDLQIHPKEIHRLIKRQTETQADLIYGNYPFQSNNFFQKVSSQLTQFIIQGNVSSRKRITSFRLLKTSLAHNAIRKLKRGEHLALKIHSIAKNKNYISIRKDYQRKIGDTSYSIWKRYLLLADIIPMSPFSAHLIFLGLLCWVIFFWFLSICCNQISFLSFLILLVIILGNILGSYPWILFVFRKLSSNTTNRINK